MTDPEYVPRKGNGCTLLLACGALARELIEFVGYGDCGHHIALVAEDAPPGAASPGPRTRAGSGSAGG